MNPWAIVIIGIGALLLIMGVKGSYSGVETALTGKKHSPPKPLSLTTASTGTQTTPASHVVAL